MTPSDLGKTKDKDLAASVTAIKRAAAMARKTAMQTDTAIVVMMNNKIVRITAAQLREKGAS